MKFFFLLLPVEEVTLKVRETDIFDYRKSRGENLEGGEDDELDETDL